MIDKEELSQFLMDLLAAMGHMDHVHSKTCHHHGIMSMPVPIRMELVERGFKLLRKLNKE